MAALAGGAVVPAEYSGSFGLIGEMPKELRALAVAAAPEGGRGGRGEGRGTLGHCAEERTLRDRQTGGSGGGVGECGLRSTSGAAGGATHVGDNISPKGQGGGGDYSYADGGIGGIGGGGGGGVRGGGDEEDNDFDDDAGFGNGWDDDSEDGFEPHKKARETSGADLSTSPSKPSPVAATGTFPAAARALIIPAQGNGATLAATKAVLPRASSKTPTSSTAAVAAANRNSKVPGQQKPRQPPPPLASTSDWLCAPPLSTSVSKKRGRPRKVCPVSDLLLPITQRGQPQQPGGKKGAGGGAPIASNAIVIKPAAAARTVSAVARRLREALAAGIWPVTAVAAAILNAVIECAAPRVTLTSAEGTQPSGSIGSSKRGKLERPSQVGVRQYGILMKYD